MHLTNLLFQEAGNNPNTVILNFYCLTFPLKNDYKLNKLM